MTHELSVYNDGQIDGRDIRIRKGDYRSHTLRFTFLEGLDGNRVKLKLQMAGKNVYYDTADGQGNVSGNKVSFVPVLWDEAGKVSLQLMIYQDTEQIRNTEIIHLVVRESIEDGEPAPELTDTRDATASAEDILTGKTAYAKGKRLEGTLVPSESGGVGENTEGKEYTIDGETVVGEKGSEIFNDYERNIASGEFSHAEGGNTKALGKFAHAEGEASRAESHWSHAEGAVTRAKANAAHAEGMTTEAEGIAAHAEGTSTEAKGAYSHAEGNLTKAEGLASHAEGGSAKASGSYSHAEGFSTVASGMYSHAEGNETIASNKSSHAGGRYNREMGAEDAFVIGNGSAQDGRSNAFRVTFTGETYGLSAFQSSGADYAEYIYEWHDQNRENEDRVGYFVTVKNQKLHRAEPGDYIAGIVSGVPSVVGNADEDWLGRWKRDDFGRILKKEIANPCSEEEDTVEFAFEQSESYDAKREYISRSKRPEWDYIGLLGVLAVRDDGTCQPDAFCKCGSGGIAVPAEEEGHYTYRVLERVSERVVKVLLK